MKKGNISFIQIHILWGKKYENIIFIVKAYILISVVPILTKMQSELTGICKPKDDNVRKMLVKKICDWQKKCEVHGKSLRSS